MKFLGIDLGWSSGASGLCCLNWTEGKLELLEVQRQLEMVDILAWIDRLVPHPEPAVIAVDAPTLIPNATGMRLPDRLAHKNFGRYHAGCYPANLGRPFATRTIEFGLSLEARGFEHAPVITPKQRDRCQIEVFPHAAMILMFRLPQILKYKKGILAERRSELHRLQHLMTMFLPRLQPALDLISLGNSDLLADPSHLGGVALKALEDKLDSLICAYIAAHWWYWGIERNLVLGDRQAGYIVIPNP